MAPTRRAEYRRFLERLRAARQQAGLTQTEVAARLRQRSNHFMPATLLDSQLAALELPPAALRVAATGDVAAVVHRVLAAIQSDSRR